MEERRQNRLLTDRLVLEVSPEGGAGEYGVELHLAGSVVEAGVQQACEVPEWPSSPEPPLKP